jgi:hypothetical protein
MAKKTMKKPAGQAGGRCAIALLLCMAGATAFPGKAQKMVTVPAGTQLLVRMVDTVDWRVVWWWLLREAPSMAGWHSRKRRGAWEASRNCNWS